MKRMMLLVAFGLAATLMLATASADTLRPPNGDFEKDDPGTSYSAITDWDYQLTAEAGNPPTGDDLDIVDDYYFTNDQSVYSYLQTTSVSPFPGNSRASQYLVTETPINTTANTVQLWIGGDGYTTSSRYAWYISLILTDGTNTYEEKLRCDCWGNNEGCTPNHYDHYDRTKTGADGTTWKRYTVEIPDDIDKSELTIKVRHSQESWDLTAASSWYRLDAIRLSLYAVGGIQALPDTAESARGSSVPYAAIAGAVAGDALVLAAGAWYAARQRRHTATSLSRRR
jgi:hypothetical protein